MKMYFGAIALTLAVPGFACPVSSADPHTNQAGLLAVQGQNQIKCGKPDRHEHCQDMMNDQANADRLAKKRAAKLDAEFNGNGHQGHKH